MSKKPLHGRNRLGFHLEMVTKLGDMDKLIKLAERSGTKAARR